MEAELKYKATDVMEYILDTLSSPHLAMVGIEIWRLIRKDTESHSMTFADFFRTYGNQYSELEVLHVLNTLTDKAPFLILERWIKFHDKGDHWIKDPIQKIQSNELMLLRSCRWRVEIAGEETSEAPEQLRAGTELEHSAQEVVNYILDTFSNPCLAKIGKKIWKLVVDNRDSHSVTIADVMTACENKYTKLEILQVLNFLASSGPGAPMLKLERATRRNIAGDIEWLSALEQHINSPEPLEFFRWRAEVAGKETPAPFAPPKFDAPMPREDKEHRYKDTRTFARKLVEKKLEETIELISLECIQVLAGKVEPGVELTVREASSLRAEFINQIKNISCKKEF